VFWKQATIEGAQEMPFHQIRLDQPAGYVIKVQGRLNQDDFCDWFTGQLHAAVETGADEQALTALTGVVADQSALHGLLTQIRDMGLVLLYVEWIDIFSAVSGEAGQSADHQHLEE
jgi:hypothetical protein